MRRTAPWLLWGVTFGAGCALVGYDFDEYKPEASGAGGGSSGTSTGGFGPSGSGSGSLASSGSGPAQCADGTQNNGETGVDCGGPCPPCPCVLAFLPRLDVDVTGSSYGVEIADMNGDDKPDILSVSHTANSVAVLQGDGTGQFLPSTSISLAAASGPAGVASADFDQDNAMDFAVTNAGSSTVGVFLNLGGTFPAQIIAAGAVPWGILPVDVNGDNIIDLVVSNTGASTISLLLGNGTGNFAVSVQLATPNLAGPVGVAAGDLDGDGDLDLAVAYRDAAAVGTFLQDGTSNYVAGGAYPVAAGPIQVALADFNSDGYLDIAASSATSPGATVLLSQSGGMFQSVMLPCGVSTAGIAAADFNGDGNIDLVAAAAPLSGLFVFAGNGDGSFQSPLNLPNVKNSVSVDIGDLNADGRPDIVSGSVDEAKVGVFLNGCLP